MENVKRNVQKTSTGPLRGYLIEQSGTRIYFNQGGRDILLGDILLAVEEGKEQLRAEREECPDLTKRFLSSGRKFHKRSL